MPWQLLDLSDDGELRVVRRQERERAEILLRDPSPSSAPVPGPPIPGGCPRIRLPAARRRSRSGIVNVDSKRCGVRGILVFQELLDSLRSVRRPAGTPPSGAAVNLAEIVPGRPPSETRRPHPRAVLSPGFGALGSNLALALPDGPDRVQRADGRRPRRQVHRGGVRDRPAARADSRRRIDRQGGRDA